MLSAAIGWTEPLQGDRCVDGGDTCQHYQRTLLATNTSSRRCFCLVEGCSVEMCVSFCVDEPAVMGKYVSVRTRNRIVALRSLLMKFLILSIFCRFEPFTRNLVTHFGSVQNLNPEPFQSNGICHHSHHRSTTHQ